MPVLQPCSRLQEVWAARAPQIDAVGLQGLSTSPCSRAAGSRGHGINEE